ncbi:hypothetical protein Pan216_33120 [Planctomycetes bacterium Pan216]|uniref:Uncharacterized protein n=1 Tax=Kolteria novifilia TaxID=2527975 RepID=A0A518B647_9BACT|nr:hypothetical protein Pan216_33120 [Planctomycetes bacterium Pan216]
MLTPAQVLDEYHLEVRCKLLEIAAIFDRYDRAGAAFPDERADDDFRHERVRASLEVLASDKENASRAEKLARIFSGPVD